MGVLVDPEFIPERTKRMRSHGLVFAAILALALLLAPAPTMPRLAAGSDGVYQVQADVSGLGFQAAQGARVDFVRAGLAAGLRSES